MTKTTHIERALLVAAGLVLVDPGLLQDLIGLGLFGLAALLQYLRRARQLDPSANNRVARLSHWHSRCYYFVLPYPSPFHLETVSQSAKSA